MKGRSPAPSRTAAASSSGDGGTLFLDEIRRHERQDAGEGVARFRSRSSTGRRAVERQGRRPRDRRDNKDLPGEIRAGRFRRTLLPPERHPDLRAALRERDATSNCLRPITFMAEFAREYGRRPKAARFRRGDGAPQLPVAGNVRELRNVIERS